MTITAKDLARMKVPQLTEYLRQRLLKLRKDPPWYWQHHEDPEDFIARTYQDSNKTFRSELAQAIKVLLQEVKIEPAQGEYLSRLLALAELTASHELLEILDQWWADRKRFEGMTGHHTEPDLLVQLISVISLLRKDEKLEQELVAYLEDARYAPAAYRGLIDIDREPVRHLDKFIKTMRLAREEVWIKVSLEFLARSRGPAKVIEEWKNEALRVEKPEWDLALKLFKELRQYKRDYHKLDLEQPLETCPTVRISSWGGKRPAKSAPPPTSCSVARLAQAQP